MSNLGKKIEAIDINSKIVYNKSTYNRIETNVDKERIINVGSLKELASSFGLPYIEEKDGVTISIVGEKQLLIFNMFYNSEETQCRLIEIY